MTKITDLEALKTAMEAGNTADMKAKMEVLAQSSMKMGEALYQAQESETESAAEAEGAETTEPSDEDDNIVDADFEEVDEEKKNKSA